MTPRKSPFQRPSSGQHSTSKTKDLLANLCQQRGLLFLFIFVVCGIQLHLNHLIRSEHEVHEYDAIEKTLEISRDDFILQPGWDDAPVVVEEYKLIFFTIPKVGWVQTVYYDTSMPFPYKTTPYLIKLFMRTWKVRYSFALSDILISILSYLVVFSSFFQMHCLETTLSTN